MAKKGGKLTKSESVQVRFDPMTKWAAEILSASQRRSLSSLVEWATERAAKQIHVWAENPEKDPLTAWDVASECWNENPYLRLLNLATQFPELLTYDDRKTWIAVSKLVGFGKQEGLVGDEENADLCWSILKEIWSSVLACAAGEIDMSELVQQYNKTRGRLLDRYGNLTAGEMDRLMKSGALDHYPNIKKLLISVLGIEME